MDAEGVGIVEVGLAGAKFVDARDGALVIVEVDSLLADVDDDTGSGGAGLTVTSGRSVDGMHGISEIHDTMTPTYAHLELQTLSPQ